MPDQTQPARARLVSTDDAAKAQASGRRCANSNATSALTTITGAAACGIQTGRAAESANDSATMAQGAASAPVIAQSPLSEIAGGPLSLAGIASPFAAAAATCAVSAARRRSIST